MKKFFLILALIAILPTITNSADKRILIEQYTGAWCGWCVDGTLMLDSLMKVYPGKIIPIRHHFGDSMSSKFSYELYNSFGAAGVPTGTLNRLNFTGKVPNGENPYLVDRSLWFSFVKGMLNEQPGADVSCSWYYDENAMLIKGVVISSLLKDLPYQQTLNAILTEDGVTGQGAGYDQNNYYAGLKGYEKHPYYKKPAVLKGYIHNAVERDCFGDKWGVKNNIKDKGYLGESYQWSFCIPLIQDPNRPININKLNLIGIASIDEADKSDILNSVIGTKEIPKTSFIYAVNGSKYFINEKTNINFTIQNFSEINSDYEIAIEYTGYGAKNWKITPSQTNFSLKAGQESNFNIEVTPNSEGMRKIKVILKNKDEKTFYAFQEITIYNKDSEKIFYSDYGKTNNSNLDELSLLDNNEYIYLNFDQKGLLENFSNSKLIIFDFSDYSAFSDINIQEIDALTKLGKKVAIIGNGIGALTKDQPKLISYWASMGLKFSEQFKTFDNAGDSTININGYLGDPISNSQKLLLKATQRNPEFSVFSYTDYNKARPVFHIAKDKSKIIAFRTEINNQRIAFLAFNLFNIPDEEQKLTLWENTIEWLMNGTGEDQAHLNVNIKELNFKIVDIGSSDTLGFYVKNTGNALLKLTSQEVISETGEYFNVKPSAYKTVNPGDSIKFEVRYTPLSKNQTKATMIIKSNDPYRDSISVSLIGKGKVNDIIDKYLGKITFNITPNPIKSNAQINFSLQELSSNITFKIVDLQGNIIKQIANGYYSIGSHNIELKVEDLIAGEYFILIQGDIGTKSIPIIISK